MLRAEREAKGISAQELSYRLQMHRTYVSRMELGQRSLDVVELLDLLEAMGVEPKAFIGRLVDEIKK